MRTPSPSFTDITCTLHEHGQAILDILNDAIENSTALYDYKPRTMDDLKAWFDTKSQAEHPVIGLMDQDSLAGFATFGPFRHFPAYKYTVEHSLYIAQDYRRQGLGAYLLKGIINEAERLNVHTLIGAIDSQNKASIALHEKHGFTHCGSLKEVGFKFGQWLNVEFYQRILATPASPTDG